ncbi:MAG: histidine kinase dimerization/phospho-acceptor domain-containing protein, partial [Anaerovoracaceae bacterium]
MKEVPKEEKCCREARLKDEMIRIAIEQAELSVWTLNIESKTIEYNLGSSKIETGREQGYLDNVPESLIQGGAVHPEDIPLLRQMYAEVFSGKERTESIIRWKDQSKGEYCWIKTVYTTLCDDEGKPVRAVGTGINITAQKKSEEQYREFEAYQYLNTGKALSAFKMNITKDRIEEKLRLSKGMNEIAKAETMSEFLARSNLNILTQGQREEHRKIYHRETLLRAFAEGRTHLELECQYNVNGEPGKYRWVKMPINLAKNPFSGDLIGFTFAIDIDDEKMIQAVMEKLTQSNFDLLACIHEQTGEFRILTESSFEEEFFAEQGKTFDEEAKRIVEQFALPEEKAAWKEQINLEGIKRNLRNNQKVELLVKIVVGKEHLIKRLTFSYLNDDKRFILCSQEDVTVAVKRQSKRNERLKEALHHAEQANRVKSTFLSGMSHDLKTPMNAIIGMTELAKLNLKDEQQLKESLAVIEASSAHLLSMINDILDMSQIEQGDMILSNEK